VGLTAPRSKNKKKRFVTKYCTRSLVGKHEDKTPLTRPKRQWEKILKCIVNIHEVRKRTGFSWLRIRSSDELFVNKMVRYIFYKSQEVFGLAMRLLAAQKALCFTEFVT
jgi:hypothetical protein